MTEAGQFVIVGRSSSHFTRVTRIFAGEMGIDYSFEVVRDLMSLESNDYGGNPALKLPTLRTTRGSWFGALNICRELARRSHLQRHIVWPEDLEEPLLANVQELVLHAMATEVSLIMSKVSGGDDGGVHQVKMKRSLDNVMSWLESNVSAALIRLPRDRYLSYLEVTLFCLVTHLEFREVLPPAHRPELEAFCARFSDRPSARETPYRFDS